MANSGSQLSLPTTLSAILYHNSSFSYVYMQFLFVYLNQLSIFDYSRNNFLVFIVWWKLMKFDIVSFKKAISWINWISPLLVMKSDDIIGFANIGPFWLHFFMKMLRFHLIQLSRRTNRFIRLLCSLSMNLQGDLKGKSKRFRSNT